MQTGEKLILVAIQRAALAGAYREVGAMDPACRPGMEKLADRAHAESAAALNEWCNTPRMGLAVDGCQGIRGGDGR